MAKVVEAQALELGRLGGRQPDAAAEVGVPQEAALWRGEDQAVESRRGPLVEVLAQHSQHRGGEPDRAPSGLALDGRHREPAGQLGRLLDDLDGAAAEVDVAAAQVDQLAPAQPAVGGDKDQRAVALRHLRGEQVDLLRSGEAHLG
ncbi:MAG TPA: hypothetical protein VFA45_24415 [Actinomycetes bacterium]|nr:hypothetical protein [Actinomycetes bacterium]